MTAVFAAAAVPRIRRAGEYDWHDRAACRGAGPDLFVPADGDARAARKAIAICRACPVREQCLKAAICAPVREWGVWGGFTERARTRIRRAYLGGARLADLIATDDEKFYAAEDYRAGAHARGIEHKRQVRALQKAATSNQPGSSTEKAAA